MKRNRLISAIAATTLLSCIAPMPTGCGTDDTQKKVVISAKPAVSYSFDESTGSTTRDAVSGKDYKIRYVFNQEGEFDKPGEENWRSLFKEYNDPLRRSGVKGKSLYMDGYSNTISNADYKLSRRAITLSAWVAPRVFENLENYSAASEAKGNPRLTAVINKGDIEMCEGFLLGYGRLGLWGVQIALTSEETGDDFVVAFYDPINALPLYEWSHIAVSFDGDTGYIGLFYNGKAVYETVAEELVSTRIITTEEPLLIGSYSSPLQKFGIKRQYVCGLMDEVRVYSKSLSPVEVRALYGDTDVQGGTHPTLEWKEVGLDSSVFAGDRYRPQYHPIPPAAWMNEPHAPFYYNGKYHVFYQHNPNGTYWEQLRWGHIVSSDMIHWEYVKDAVVPTAGICPTGVWTGGAVIGPDNEPWLVITAGTDQSTWSGQAIAFAHPKDKNDPYLVEWVLEDKVAIAQPDDDSQGERDQFRDPFVWYDDGLYYMLVSTSVPASGGSANVYVSEDMRNWEYRGYLFECDYMKYPEAGIHWECVVMLPISTADGSVTKYILFDTPQYANENTTVECYYWIGTFDKITCKFIPDDEKPKLFDMGRGIFTGQNGYCYLTEQDKASGKTSYTQGRTVVYAIAQGKAAGTDHNVISGWAHNFAFPIELMLSDDGNEVIRKPIKELESIRIETLYDYTGTGKTAAEVNSDIAAIRGDTLEIEATFTLEPSADVYSGGISVRYNKSGGDNTERTDIKFGNTGVYIDRSRSSLHNYVDKMDSHTFDSKTRTYTVTILLDRSMLEVYLCDGNGKYMNFTTRIYPKYGDSDYLHIFDDNAGIKFESLKIYRMGSAYSNTLTPAYYGNVGNLADNAG